eukprot:2131102-Pyramimonas_sp.AAC.1
MRCRMLYQPTSLSLLVLRISSRIDARLDARPNCLFLGAVESSAHTERGLAPLQEQEKPPSRWKVLFMSAPSSVRA